jgi:hypothetical protein
MLIAQGAVFAAAGCTSPLGDRASSDGAPPDAAESQVDAGGADGSTVPAWPGSGSVQAEAGFVGGDGLFYQALWRGGARYWRTIPFAQNGVLDRDAASDWSEPQLLADFPGSGDMQGETAEVISGVLHQLIWRGGQRWRRELSLAETGAPVFDKDVAWSGPTSIEVYPGSGDVQNYNAVLTPDGQVRESYWRGNEGYHRAWDVSGAATVDWDNSFDWNGPLFASEYPGLGSLDAQDSFAGNDLLFHQSYWRSGKRYVRSVPFQMMGTPDFDLATEWTLQDEL